MKIAIVQDGPIFNNLKETIEKTCDLISMAKDEKADLVVFGECWLSGYPVWLDVCKDANLWDHAPIKEVWASMYQNSVDCRSNDLDLIKKVINDTGVNVVIGANEKQSSGRGNHTIYNSIFTFDTSGELVNCHRKLMPTYTEKLVHGMGDGNGLNAIDTSFGRLGSLICWEHWMPMARQAMHDEAEDLHIALWPFVKDMHHLASRQYAIEGRCHVVSVGQIMELSELPIGLEISDTIQVEDNFLLKGGSAVYGPDGEFILEPVKAKRELILLELDLKSNIKERMNLSVSGHYQRPDIFDYKVNKERKV